MFCPMGRAPCSNETACFEETALIHLSTTCSSSHIFCSVLFKHSVTTCSNGHMAATGNHIRARTCLVCHQPNKAIQIGAASTKLQEICRKENAFNKPMYGFQRSCESSELKTERGTSYYYFHDGRIFQEMYAPLLRKADKNRELYFFVSFSTNGFTFYENFVHRNTSWPLIFSILNLYLTLRLRVCNVVPGENSGDNFHTLLEPIINYM